MFFSVHTFHYSHALVKIKHVCMTCKRTHVPLTAPLLWKMLTSQQVAVVWTKVSVSCFLDFDVRIQGLGHFITLVCYRSSVLQASMLLSQLMVKMKTRKKITPNRPPHPVLFPSLSLPWNIESKSNLYPDKTK